LARLLVVSHAAVLGVNQLPYAELRRYGWEPVVVTPSKWRHEYADTEFRAEVLPELAGRVVGRQILLAGRVQRHMYVTLPKRLIKNVSPDVAFLEEEPTSVSAMQWGESLGRLGIPFGVQVAENMERPWPLPARLFRTRTLRNVAFVAARSPTAAALVQTLRPGTPTAVIPHHVPQWPSVPSVPRDSFVIGFAGRLVRAKGLDVLIEAASGMADSVVHLVGNGPMREELERQAATRSVALVIDSNIKHEDMALAYRRFDVLVLPSRTTATWVEQFGRVLVEAMWCGVPVIGSDSGEIPWVINSTGAGLLFPEGDSDALREALVTLRDSAELRRELGERGREQARARFSVEAVAREFNRALLAALHQSSERARPGPHVRDRYAMEQSHTHRSAGARLPEG
jgi:glycosyltransferase involved in cell wall biosynthesis